MSGSAPRSASPSWDAVRYLRFAGERMRPAIDLLQRIPADIDPRRIVDLGCGTGEVTLELKRRWPEAMVEGLDNAASMLANARGLSRDVDWI